MTDITRPDTTPNSAERIDQGEPSTEKVLDINLSEIVMGYYAPKFARKINKEDYNFLTD